MTERTDLSNGDLLAWQHAQIMKRVNVDDSWRTKLELQRAELIKQDIQKRAIRALKSHYVLSPLISLN